MSRATAPRTILVTGGTGTLGRELVRRLSANADRPRVIVLARTPDSPGARALLHTARPSREGAPPSESPSVPVIVAGDLCAAESLGMERACYDELRLSVTDILHCAADTAFTRPLDEARAINVGGTGATLDFAAHAPRLERVTCFSTVYVAGKRTGCIAEDDPGGGDGFVNSYEQSKWEMEALVRAAMPHLPVAIHRLSTIVGDSRTGEVTGLNAVHDALRLLYQGLAPMVPGGESTPVDLIPVDFAAAAAHHIHTHAFAPGATYHLCAGPRDTLPLGALLDATIAAFERFRPAWRKRSIARPALVDLPTYELFVRTVEEAGNEVLLQATRAVAAFACQLAYPKLFDDRRATDALADSGIRPPPVLDYFSDVVRWCIEKNWGRGA